MKEIAFRLNMPDETTHLVLCNKEGKTIDVINLTQKPNVVVWDSSTYYADRSLQNKTNEA